MGRRARKRTIQIQVNAHLRRDMVMSGNKGHRKDMRAYYRRDLGYNGDHEPHNTLRNRYRSSGHCWHNQREPPQPHLCPKEACETKHIGCEAHTEQANEHDEKQDHVGSDRSNDVKSATVCIGHGTGVQHRYPCGAELQLDEVRKSKPH